MDISTQTDFSNVAESTQTDWNTTEMGCQTDNSTTENDTDSAQWKIDNPLKRKLYITLAFDPKMSRNNEDENLETFHEHADEITPNTSVSVTCQPDIATIMPKKDNCIKSETVKAKKSSRKTKKASKIEEKEKAKSKSTKRKVKRKAKPVAKQETESSESDNEVDYDTLMASRLEEAIKLIQQQWSIHEKKYRKDADNETVIEDPVEKLQIKQGRAYGNELKLLALNLFYSNPVAYKALRQNLNLPTEKTLRRIEVGLSTKLTPTVLNCLKLIVSKLNEEDKFCIVCANLLPLKEGLHKMANSEKSVGYHEINEVQGTELASKALVVLIKSLYSDWKQPLITCYLKENFDILEVNAWLDGLITSLLEIGLKVIGFTTNESPHLIAMAKQRGINTDRPYFYIDTHKIYYIFDMLHVMNSIRNLLLNYYFRFLDVDGTEQIVSWFDIEKLYETDKARLYKLAPKLTENHIRPNGLDRTRIWYTSQVFSKTVAAGIISCIELKHLTSRSYGTVKFVELMNNTFDILNSHDEKELCQYKIPFCFKDYQIEVLNKMLTILPNLKIITKNYEDITESVETMKCLEITIKSALNMASDLKNYGFNYLQCRNLNMEQLDVFFESLRRKWGAKATTVLFYAGFRNFFLENVIKKSENNDSCGLDKDFIAILMKDDSETKESSEEVNKESYNPFYKYL